MGSTTKCSEPEPADLPTAFPSPVPTAFPSPVPTAFPSPVPTAFPSDHPTVFPTSSPEIVHPTDDLDDLETSAARTTDGGNGADNNEVPAQGSGRLIALVAAGSALCAAAGVGTALFVRGR